MKKFAVTIEILGAIGIIAITFFRHNDVVISAGLGYKTLLFTFLAFVVLGRFLETYKKIPIKTQAIELLIFIVVAIIFSFVISKFAVGPK